MPTQRARKKGPTRCGWGRAPQGRGGLCFRSAKPDHPRTITRKDGTASTRRVERVGKGFKVDGVFHRYGYLAEGELGTAPAPKPAAPVVEYTETWDDETPTVATAPRRPEVGTRCDACGKRGFRAGLHLAIDMSGLPGTACNACDDGFLSFG